MREPVNLINEGRKLDPDMFELSFILNSEELLTMIKWELILYTDVEIQIQLTFNKPLLVSAGMQPDVIKLHMSRFLFLPVYEPYLRVDINDESYDQRTELTLETDLPAQAASKSKWLPFSNN